MGAPPILVVEDLSRAAAAPAVDASGKVRAEGYELVTEECILIAEQPRIAGRRGDMRARLAATIGVEAHRIAVRATSTERLGFTGRGGGLAAKAVVALER